MSTRKLVHGNNDLHKGIRNFQKFFQEKYWLVTLYDRYMLCKRWLCFDIECLLKYISDRTCREIMILHWVTLMEKNKNQVVN